MNLLIAQTEGLPDITGSIVSKPNEGATNSGAISNAGGAFTYTVHGSSNSNVCVNLVNTYKNADYVYFSAKNSNPIYGRSDHVTPGNIGVRCWLRNA